MQDQHKTRQALVEELQALRERVKGLEASAARRDDAQDQLRESEAKFSTIFRSSPEVITITSITEGRILDVNDSFTRTTGYGREEAIGRTTLELGIWGDGEDRARMTEALQRHGSIRDLDFIFRSRDGRRIHGLVSAGTVDIAGTPCLLAVIRDITDKKREERALAIMNRIQDVFLKITDDSLYAKVLDILLEAVESPFGYFAFMDEHGDLVSPSMTKDVWDKCRMNRKSIVFPRESWGGLWGASLTQGRTLIANGGLRAPEGHVPLSRAICVPRPAPGSCIIVDELVSKCVRHAFTKGRNGVSRDW